MNWKSKERYFTLIELLVVIAIIAILAAMLLPTLGKVKEVGRKAFCMNNMKTFNNLNISYASNYDDYGAPIYIAGPSDSPYKQSNYGTKYAPDCPEVANGPSLSLPLLLAGDLGGWNHVSHDPLVAGPLYKNMPKFMACPSGKKHSLYSGNYNFSTWIPSYKHTTSSSLGGPKMPMSRIKSPGRSVYMWESGSGTDQDYNNYFYPNSDYFNIVWNATFFPGTHEWYTATPWGGTHPRFTKFSAFGKHDIVNGRHNRTLNFSFYDGHVENVKGNFLTRKAPYNSFKPYSK